jgi:fatty acid-binding protein DegV
MTYKIITDSTTDLSDAYMAAHDVVMLGLTVTLDETTYQTVGLDRLTSDVLLEKMAAGAKPVTSQINVGQFSETLNQLSILEMMCFILDFHQACQGPIKVLKWLNNLF